jgi:polysaccharide biosynthesis/export protein
MLSSFNAKKIANPTSNQMSDLQRNSPAATQVAAGHQLNISSSKGRPLAHGWWMKLTVLTAALAVVTGCETQHLRYDESQISDDPGTNAISHAADPTHSETIVLREGDTIRIIFPTAANLNSTSTIRRDGDIALTLIGDVKAAGKTLKEFKADLLALYKDQTDSREMTLELLSSVFPVFVTGAVLSPHKVMSDHPITALEAVMECGGFDMTKANTKSVVVLRWENAHLQSYHLNLRNVLKGKDEKRFYMEPGDILLVKEKFTWF